MNRLLIASVSAITLIAVGCAKKTAVATPPAPPSPAATTAQTPRPTPAPQRAATTTPSPAPTPAARPRTPDAATRARIDQLLARIEDAYFDYNQSSLRPDALKALQADSTELRDIIVQYPDYKLTIEGHCDERGSAEYNLALGDRRAEAAKDYLAGVGIPATQLSVVSYGKEHPVCEEHDEACWQKNRRVHIIAMAR